MWLACFCARPGNDNDPAAAEQQAGEAFALANRMADAIADQIRKHGQCRPRDLEKMGFTRDEIAEAWSLASPWLPSKVPADEARRPSVFSPARR